MDAILVLDGDGNRLAGKYYGDFLKQALGDQSAEDLRAVFEKQLHQKMGGTVARPDAAEVVTCQGRTAVYCSSGNSGPSHNPHEVRVVHVGPSNESELVLAYLCEGMYDALSQLMGGATDRGMILDNLELVFLLIDEHCDGGIILEVDGTKLASAVLLRDEEAMNGGGMEDAGGMPKSAGGMAAGGGGGMPGSVATSDLTIGQAFEVARRQFMANMTSRDGM